MSIIIIGYGQVGRFVHQMIESKKLGSIDQIVKSRKESVPKDTCSKILIDCTASRTISENYEAWIQSGNTIITANKFPILKLPYEKFSEYCLQNNRSLLFNATVCTNIPIFALIDSYKTTGESISGIKATVSTTLGYISRQLLDGCDFEKSVKKATELGYVEPDFRRDLSGEDVLTKAMIISRYLGFDIKKSDILVEPFSKRDCDKKLANNLKYGLSIIDHRTVKVGWVEADNWYGVDVHLRSGQKASFAANGGGPENAARALIQDLYLVLEERLKYRHEI